MLCFTLYVHLRCDREALLLWDRFYYCYSYTCSMYITRLVKEKKKNKMQDFLNVPVFIDMD